MTNVKKWMLSVGTVGSLLFCLSGCMPTHMSHDVEEDTLIAPENPSTNWSATQLVDWNMIDPEQLAAETANYLRDLRQSSDSQTPQLHELSRIQDWNSLQLDNIVPLYTISKDGIATLSSASADIIDSDGVVGNALFSISKSSYGEPNISLEAISPDKLSRSIRSTEFSAKNTQWMIVEVERIEQSADSVNPFYGSQGYERYVIGDATWESYIGDEIHDSGNMNEEDTPTVVTESSAHGRFASVQGEKISLQMG